MRFFKSGSFEEHYTNMELHKWVAFPFNCKNENKGKIALKLHRQFGHPESTKLKSLLKDAKIEDEILNKELDKLDGSCEFCEKYKRKNPLLLWHCL